MQHHRQPVRPLQPWQSAAARLLGAGSALLLIGCGGAYDAQVSGSVHLDGKPLERGVVAYYPEQGGPVGHGVIGPDGRYVVMTGREPGIPPGKYAVTVVSHEGVDTRPGYSGPPPPGRRLTAERLADKTTTDLHYTVESGENTINLDLSS